MFSGLTLPGILVVVAGLVLSVVIHEIMHGYVAYKLGDDTALEEGRLSFNPLNHIDPFMTVALPIISLLVFHFPVLAAKPVPFNPARLKFDDYGAALVAAAGPVSNFLIAFVMVLAIRLIPMSLSAGAVLERIAELNVILFVFNLVPIPPLDGSRVVYAFAPDSIRRLFEQFEPVGLYVVFGLVIVGGFNALLNIDQSVLNFLYRL